MTKQNILMEVAMSNLKKSECVTLDTAQKEIEVSRTTLSAYIAALGIQKQRFQFDRRVYITKDDFNRLKQFVEENKA